jgi:hipA N-terminal domain protein
MVTEGFRVLLGGKTVAHLYARGDYTWLEWQQGYWDDPDRPMLGLRFEDNPEERVAAALRLPPWFSNLLPEGRLRQWVALDAGINEQREMRLLVRLGLGLPGAVIVEPVEGEADPAWRPEQVQFPAVRRHDGQVLRFSLAGVALKFSLLQSGDRLTLPAGDQEGDWIVKMPDAVYPEVPANEFAMMSLAQRCGIDVPEIKMWHRDELPTLPEMAWPKGQEWAYAIRRFDREGNSRIHIEDLAQVRGFYPDRKYDGSFETAAALVYRGRDEVSYLEFIRRLFFSFAIGNGDMHLKNTSLIYRDPRYPVISPAYDLVSTAPYREDAEDLGLTLGRSRRFDEVTAQSFELLARKIGAPAESTIQIVAEVAGQLAGSWPEVSQLMDKLPRHREWLDLRLPEISRRFAN